ncbi:uncharacterized protein RJT21DRAFT_38731 [Scheffersomyces amazonensis]|uniref:uncharacterized protein n=1 Tax=Scheffersomyces amazonensis TaxID=1078765 RepID=UPI00315C57F6
MSASTNGQFPPSSPLISNEDYAVDEDPFTFKPKQSYDDISDKHLERGRTSTTEYPTPNPSSALFRSSSPAPSNNIISRNDIETQTPEPQPPKKVTFDLDTQHKVRINKDFNILNPDAKVSRIPLLASKSHITIGRSSKSCDFAINAKNSFISRCHLSLTYNSQQIVLNCLGQNGVTINIPKPCFVYATNSVDNYLVMENKSGKPLSLNDLKLVKSKSIKLDQNSTQFYIRRNETITIPRLTNILLEISNSVLLINPEDVEEDLTEDEMPTLITPIKSTIKSPPQPKTPSKTSSEIRNQTELEDSQKQIAQAEVDLQEQEQEQEQEHEHEQEQEIEPTPSKPPILLQPNPKPITKFKIFEDVQKEEEYEPTRVPTPEASIKRQSTPLNDKSNTFSNPATPKFKRSQSEEPPKQKKKKKNDLTSEPLQKVEINQEWIASIENVDEINNILINHLAFSRLSSTPVSFLRTISVVTSRLELNQLRVVLHNVKCIGVIYRQGKDAAGKPLEEEYYYMPENDDDLDRTKLVANLKGHQGLRSCRRTHKQYYWKKPASKK